MKKIVVLGSTGSIGTQTLEIVRYHKDIRVAALAARSNITLLEAQAREFLPELVCVWEEEKAKELAGRLKDLPVKSVELFPCRGLTSFYAMEKGLIIGY